MTKESYSIVVYPCAVHDKKSLMNHDTLTSKLKVKVNKVSVLCEKIKKKQSKNKQQKEAFVRHWVEDASETRICIIHLMS